MSNFQIGDIVKVINGGQRYTTYVSKILEMYEHDCNCPLRTFKREYLVRYSYCDNEQLPLEDFPNEYKILYLYENFVLIEAIEDFYKRIFLIDIKGIERIKSKQRIYLEENFTKDELIDMIEPFFEIKEIKNERSE